MENFSQIGTPRPPWIMHTKLCAEELLENIVMQHGELMRDGFFTLNGGNMRTYQDMFEEFSRRLSFPDYFGGNMNALDECLADLEWLEPDRIIIYISNGHKLLNAEEKEAKDSLFVMLERIAEEWSRPIQLGEEWDREAVPFHVLIQQA